MNLIYIILSILTGGSLVLIWQDFKRKKVLLSITDTPTNLLKDLDTDGYHTKPKKVKRKVIETLLLDTNYDKVKFKIASLILANWLYDMQFDDSRTDFMRSTKENYNVETLSADELLTEALLMAEDSLNNTQNNIDK